MRPASSCRLYDYSSPAPSYQDEATFKKQREEELRRQLQTAIEQLQTMVPNAGRWNAMSSDVETLITVVDYIHRLEAEWYEMDQKESAMASLNEAFAKLSTQLPTHLNSTPIIQSSPSLSVQSSPSTNVQSSSLPANFGQLNSPTTSAPGPATDVSSMDEDMCS